MIVNKNDLKTALEVVKPAISNKEIVEQANSFAFMGDRVVTFNDEFSISHPTSILDLHGVIKADELYGWLAKIKKEEIEIEQQDNEIIFSCGKSKIGLRLKDMEMPIEEVGELPKKGWKKVPANFIEALIFCSPCCSTDFAKPILRCVNIEGNLVQASDSYKLAKFIIDSEMEYLLIPATSIREVIKMNPISYCKKQGWVHFKTENETIISCRVLDDAFPNTSKVMDFEGIDLKLPANLLENLERAQVFSKNEAIKVSMEKRKLTISSSIEEGWIEESSNLKYDGEPFTFMVNPDSLKVILNKSHEALMGTGRIKFEGENWSYLTLLMVVK